MSVWVVLPSARPINEVKTFIANWRDMGYRVALMRDSITPEWRELHRQMSSHISFAQGIWARYPGYAVSVNWLALGVFTFDQDCDWVVATGDDTDPDPNVRAEEIAGQCTDRFAGTFGVMQPTGDPWSDHQGRIIERIAGSPWLGRQWCARINSGRGPLWPEYTHCFADEELQCVAQKLGVFWQRPDLTQMHNNWARARGDVKDRPAFLDEANSPEHWRKYSTLFRERKAGGFPGHEPLAQLRTIE